MKLVKFLSGKGLIWFWWAAALSGSLNAGIIAGLSFVFGRADIVAVIVPLMVRCIVAWTSTGLWMALNTKALAVATRTYPNHQFRHPAKLELQTLSSSAARCRVLYRSSLATRLLALALTVGSTSAASYIKDPLAEPWKITLIVFIAFSALEDLVATAALVFMGYEALARRARLADSLLRDQNPTAAEGSHGALRNKVEVPGARPT